MKKFYHILTTFATACSITGCAYENPIDTEQYIKQVYLVNKEFKYTCELKYSTEAQEAFVPVACGGSQSPDRDIEVTLDIDTAGLNKYNNTYIGVGNEEKFLQLMADSLYSIPSPMKTTIPAGEINAILPVMVKTEHLHCDSLYTIPFRIASVSAYEINPNVNSSLLTFNLINDYSGDYTMEGKKDGADITSTKTLNACGIHSVRMLYGTLTQTTDDPDQGYVVLNIDPVTNKVTIESWEGMKVVNGTGTYNPEQHSFTIEYDFETDNGTIHYQEILTKK